MDIIKTKKTSVWRHPRNIVGGIVVSMLLVGFLYLTSRDNYEHKIKRDNLLFGVVQRGDLQVSVDGYGVLRSQKQTLITTLTEATVKEVVLRPGAPVKKDTIILILSNPELIQEVTTAKIALDQERANLRLTEINSKRELLAEESILSNLESEYESATLRLQAEEILANEGIIAQNTFKNTVLEQARTKKSLEFQKRRISQLKSMNEESILIQKNQIEQAEAQYKNIKGRADRLTVRAGINGVLQRLPVVLGQSVIAGEELALVGSDKDLVALVRISQAKAEYLRIGQLAEIDTRRETVSGSVTRITPEVNEGTIEIEVNFTDGVPVSARPELNISARIYIENLSDSLFIERPINALGNTNSVLFKVHGDSAYAQKQEVLFGEGAGRFIQVLEGAKEHDQFILSDTASFRDASRIKIIN